VKKKEEGRISLQIPAQQANPSPPIGPALGQRGLNIMDFCNRFNNLCKEKKISPGEIIPVIIKYFADKRFEIETKQSPVPYLIKKFVGLKSGSKKPGTEWVGSIEIDQVEEIAMIKMEDMGVSDVKSAMRMVKGTCVSIGVRVEE
jgi:large subunit ribosomal protein L11